MAYNFKNWAGNVRGVAENYFQPTNENEIIEIVKKEKSENLESAITATLQSFLSNKPRSIVLENTHLTTILIVGVNGTGKTTSAAKLAHYFKSRGKKVLLVAADTFRAAAVEQRDSHGVNPRNAGILQDEP